METVDVRRRALEQKPSYGMVMSMTDPFVLELAYHAVFHYVRIDCEHVFYDNTSLRTLLDAARNIGIAAQIRIPDLNRIDALLALEPAGICIPDMNRAEKAIQVIEAVKFPPVGKRGRSVTRRVRLGEISRVEYAATGNERLNLIVQIENQEGLDHIDEILSLEGIDMVASGRSDLAESLGVAGQRDNPIVMEAEDLIIRKAQEYGKLLTLSVSNRERLQKLYKKGVYCYSIGRDEELLNKALRNQVKEMSVSG